MKFKNDQEYFADKTHISNSMIGDYLKSPAYYKAKHTDQTIEQTKTPAMILGSALDCLLTESEDKFNSTYSEQCLKRDNPEQFELNKTGQFEVLTPAAWKQVHNMADLVKQLPLFQEIKDKSDKQIILTGEFQGMKTKGKLDFLVIDGEIATIIDLKSSAKIEPVPYHYHALTYGYYRQMAMYSDLVRQNYKEVNNIICKHIVVSKDTDWSKCSVFTLDGNRIAAEILNIGATLNNIKEGKFEEIFEEHEIGAMRDEYETL